MATTHKTKNYIRNGQKCNVTTDLGGSVLSALVLTNIWSTGQGVIGAGLKEGNIRVFATSAAGTAGTFLYELCPGASNTAGATVGSGSTEGTDLFTSGKNNYSAVVTLDATKLAAVEALRLASGGNVVFVFDPLPNFEACIHLKAVGT